MKRNIKLALAELEQEMEIIQKQDLKKYKGGSSSGVNIWGTHPSGDCPMSCVFQVLDYLDGNLHDACFYSRIANNMGVTPDENGMIPIEMIQKLAVYGGLEAKPLDKITDRTFSEGGNIIGLMYTPNGNHVVEVTGCHIANGTTFLHFKDHTSGQYSTGLASSFFGAFKMTKR